MFRRMQIELVSKHTIKNKYQGLFLITSIENCVAVIDVVQGLLQHSLLAQGLDETALLVAANND